MTNAKVARRQHAVKKTPPPPRSEARDAVSELVVHVFRLNGLLVAIGDAMAQVVGQTSARWRVLAAIDHGPMTVAQVARAWWLTRQSVQRVADVLVDEGLAEYRDNPDHRRAKLLRITRRGRSALHAIRDEQRRWADRLGGELDAADLRQANAVLAQVVGALARERSGSANGG